MSIAIIAMCLPSYYCMCPKTGVRLKWTRIYLVQRKSDRGDQRRASKFMFLTTKPLLGVMINDSLFFYQWMYHKNFFYPFFFLISAAGTVINSGTCPGHKLHYTATTICCGILFCQ